MTITCTLCGATHTNFAAILEHYRTTHAKVPA